MGLKDSVTGIRRGELIGMLISGVLGVSKDSTAHKILRGGGGGGYSRTFCAEQAVMLR